jgi:hypothetical protein
MEIPHDARREAQSPGAHPSDVLQRWYDGTPAVQRLWALRPQEPDGAPALRVLVTLAPAADSEETTPVWMARRAQWTQDLSRRLAGPVQIERLERPPADAFDLERDGLVCALCWRDASSSA